MRVEDDEEDDDSDADEDEDEDDDCEFVSDSTGCKYCLNCLNFNEINNE